MFGFYVNDNFIRLQSYDNNLINAISGVTNTFPYVSCMLVHLERIYVNMSAEFLGSIIEDGEFGTHEEAAVVEYHFIGTASLDPFIAVGTTWQGHAHHRFL